MYLNKFSVRVIGGNEQQGGYVDMLHGQQYSLQMRNARQERCDARVVINGEHVGTWRIDPLQSININRPAHDTGKFTFYRLSSQEGQRVAPVSASADPGLISVTFTPELAVRPVQLAPEPFLSRSLEGSTRSMSFGGSHASTRSAGVTGLSGQSHQRFGTAGSINYDHEQRTTINLRLVCVDNDGPRPLVSRSTPVPPPIA